ncbi:FMN-linked oxidoreductase [Sistotremastrum niveocremeum HHB9708]|uniref:FMN-linked oxidoreductase n=1 Tax=Sistotremastrum niveocremeum HHB9708 TaxID=1314777 RepID=A0A164T4L3_9AGAM|nr:FMN-linked oxidoreductase [Sistotremastrum niveocremeum HHB9708]
MPNLNSPLKMGAILLKNRNVMASLTRNRSVPTSIPNTVNTEYYAQRAMGGAGLILTEGTLIAQQGTEWPHAAGIWSNEHVAGWSHVTKAVHEAGGQIFAQLWHLGRVSHPDMPEQIRSGQPVYGPSAIAARGGKFRQLPGQPGYVTPTAIEDPWALIELYRNAATKAKAAGFDGVELHSANGYLVHQFLDSGANKRTDQWGGSAENRCRFGVEALKALLETWEPGRVGIKLNPCGGYNDVGMPLGETKETYGHYIKEISKLRLAYVQLVNYSPVFDPELDGKKRATPHDVLETYGPLIDREHIAFLLNGGLTPNTANHLISSGKIDAAVFGSSWIAQPDFQRRVEAEISDEVVGKIDYTTLYNPPPGSSPRTGYSDYEFATPLTDAEKKRLTDLKEEALNVVSQ